MNYKGIPGVYNYFEESYNPFDKGDEGVQGFIPALIANNYQTNTRGVSIAGIINNSKRDLIGVNIAGLVNLTDYENALGDIKGVSVAGITNNSAENLEGIALAGICNSARHSLRGVGAASLNEAGMYMDGLLVGLFNFTRFSRGVLIGGLNHSKERAKGVYIGVVNALSTYDGWSNTGFSGISIGAVNYARTSKGFACQIGIYNNISENGGATLQLGLINRSGNRTIPGININGVRKYFKEKFAKKKKSNG